MPWLTPDDIPEGAACRPLFIPDSTDWLAIVSGAIDALTKEYNWEEFGTLTPEECAERMQEMMQQYYEDACSGCVLPDGEHIIRIGFDGHFEELIDGAWVAPEGDYAVPPVEERTGGTSEDQRCLASANAVNVLSLLYEQVTDDFEEHLSASEALLALGVAIGTAIAGPIGLLAGSVLAIGLIAFGEFFSFMDFLTDDVWDAEFTDALQCMFYECSLNDAGVVTFDIDCIWNKLVNEGNPFDLSGTQIRLLGQVGYLLSIVGVDGLNLAGNTTAITTADCSECSDAWCFTFNFEETNGGFTPNTESGCTATWGDGIGWYVDKGGGCAAITGQSVLANAGISFASTYIRHIVVVGTSDGRTTGQGCAVAFPAATRTGTPAVICLNEADGVPVGVVLNVNGFMTGASAEFQNTAPSGVSHSDGRAIIKQMTFYGNGDCPFGDPNCLE